MATQTKNNPPANNHPMQTRSKNLITKPNTKFFLSTTVSDKIEREPQTLNRALEDERWWMACSSEFDAQLKNQTWHLVPPAPHQNLVGNKWVLRIKQLLDGSLDKYKGRLVAKGFTQRPGINFYETFSPAIKSTTIRTVLKVAVSKNWCLRQIDVNNAFLQGTLKSMFIWLNRWDLWMLINCHTFVISKKHYMA